MTDTERLAALLTEALFDGLVEVERGERMAVLDADASAALLAERLVAAGVRVGPFATAYWTKSGVLHIDATGVDTTPRIDPDRLARALDAVPGEWDEYAPTRLAAAIVKAYEEEE